MNYVPFTNLGFDVSRLGFGMMRLPTMKNDQGNDVINRAEAIRMVRRAIDQGLNYVDTAYGYHGGESEIVTGLALKEGYRERVKLTTKLPQWLVNEHADMDRLLDEQLKKLDVSCLDFYLLHALHDEAFSKLQRLNYQKFLQKAQADGRVRHVGFSFHDNHKVFLRILDDYDWDMAQIQFNYLDDQFQAGVDGLLYAGKKGISVVVMEPLRGGALASPPEPIKKSMAFNSSGFTPVEWAFRYVGDFPQVVTILSGMSTMEQVQDNLRVFKHVKPNSLTEEQHDFIKDLKKQYLARVKVGCTGCDYCQPCPQGVKIPRIFKIYNESYMLGNMDGLKWHYDALVKEKADASQCVACGACEAACPQQLPIIDTLKLIDSEAR